MSKLRSSRNRTLSLAPAEMQALQDRLPTVQGPLKPADIRDRIFCADTLTAIDHFPAKCVDLLFLDPPYNLDKDFQGSKFTRLSDADYLAYLESWFPRVLRLLKENASVYLCGDWRCCAAMYTVMSRHLLLRNRITWQREKGRGSRTNWKNCSEDIWFGTMGKEYYFDVDAVMQKRKVIAPYRQDGQPKDWQESAEGNFRLSHPANFWDDITVPYWSMPENTDHPTQKPEKLLAKLILASSRPGDLVFDPFLGSGTSAVVAKKLGRHYSGLEINPEYCCWALKRLQQAGQDNSIQGYCHGVFWERNTYSQQKKAAAAAEPGIQRLSKRTARTQG